MRASTGPEDTIATNMLSPHYMPAHCAVQHNIPYKAHTQHPAQRIREVH